MQAIERRLFLLFRHGFQYLNQLHFSLQEGGKKGEYFVAGRYLYAKCHVWILMNKNDRAFITGVPERFTGAEHR
jgi:hypothetical protein